MTARKNPPYTKNLRRSLRRTMTECEVKFWNLVRNKNEFNYRVKRQFGVGPFVLDFYIPKIKLAIEIDGKVHLSNHNKSRDKERDLYIQNEGITVYRFTNEQILNDMKSCLMQIHRFIDDFESFNNENNFDASDS